MVDRRLAVMGEGGGAAVELSSRLRSSTGWRLRCLFRSNYSISASFASSNLFFWIDLVAYKKFLRLLLSSALFGPTSRSSFESDEEIITLFSSINLTVLCCLTEDGDEANIVDHVSQKSIETLFRIVKASNDKEEIASAMGIISNLTESPQITEWLFGAGVFV